MKLKSLSVQFGGFKLSLAEATIPHYILLAGLAVVVIVVTLKGIM